MATAVLDPGVTRPRRSLRVEVDELVTGAEACRRLGVSRQWIYMRNHEDRTFPAPVGAIGKSLVWRWPAIEGWVEATGWVKRGG